MKYIPIKKCGDCDRYFRNSVREENLFQIFYRKKICTKLDIKVDPETIHKDCPLDDLPEFPKEGEHVCSFVLDLKTGDYKLKQ